eukprot:scaffold138008_cov31-Tisochrysis_lutea.AAC.9
MQLLEGAAVAAASREPRAGVLGTALEAEKSTKKTTVNAAIVFEDLLVLLSIVVDVRDAGGVASTRGASPARM